MKEATFLSELKRRLRGKTVLLGVGNEQRGDDAVGSLLARRLTGRENFTAIDCSDVPENYTGPVKELRPESIFFVDAVDFGGSPGEAAFIEPESLEENRFNTHRPSLRFVMDYLQRETGSQISFLGIQPGTIAPGIGMTPAVQETMELLVSAITEILDMMSDEGENS